jgi:hypothetical protein
MPRSTVKHAFEHGLLGWASQFRDGDGLLALFGPAGTITEVYVGEADQYGKRLVSHELKDRITQQHSSWMFFDPFDWPEYAWLQWNQVPRATLRQMLGEHGEQWRKALGESAESFKDLPETWGVMF